MDGDHYCRDLSCVASGLVVDLQEEDHCVLGEAWDGDHVCRQLSWTVGNLAVGADGDH